MSQKMHVLGALAVATMLLPAAPARATDPIKLAPHRALYNLTLERAHSGSGVTSVRGEMAVEWLRGCDGWTFEHRSVMSIEVAAGEPIRLETTATSWESLDGTGYHFSMRNVTGEKGVERIEGSARLERPGGPGRAELGGEKGKRFALPPGTLFPVAHTAELLRRARRGPPPVLFSAIVFDGMGDEGPLNATATVGTMRRHEAKADLPATKLADEAMWPVNIAYFPVASPAPLPKQEIAMQLFANGVADDLRIGFDDFIVRATLGRLEFVPDPDCKGQ